MLASDLQTQHHALTTTAGFADLGHRARVQISGKDRAQLLHGLCTNNIKALKPAEGCEAFLTNVQGKTIGYVYVFCEPDRLILDSAPGQTASIIQNLDRYVIREDVKFQDRGPDTCEILLSGLEAIAVLRQMGCEDVPSQPLQHLERNWNGANLNVRRVPYAGSTSFFLNTKFELRDALVAELRRCGAMPVELQAVEVARIEAGSPEFGIDVTDDTLPQEVNRNHQAIHFNKGCYLGQETVARIDALGHVNRTLCGLKFQGAEIPPKFSDIAIEGKSVARLTSVCLSVRLNAPFALGYVRRGHNHLGARFASPWGDVEVVPLPVESGPSPT